jgi:Resolvase, N terminal domain
MKGLMLDTTQSESLCKANPFMFSCAAYTRVSGRSNRQDTTNQSLQLIEYCQRQGWDFVEYTDRMTGTRADRAEFQRMFEDARLQRIDLVLFWALDRLSREGTLKTLEYLQRLDIYGVIPAQDTARSGVENEHPALAVFGSGPKQVIWPSSSHYYLVNEEELPRPCAAFAFRLQVRCSFPHVSNTSWVFQEGK